MEECAEEL